VRVPSSTTSMAKLKNPIAPLPAVVREAELASSRAPRWLRVAIPVALVLATLASFWACLGYGFVELDDDLNFVMNMSFRGLSPEHLRWMWSLDGFHLGHWHPLTWTSFGLDYALYGLDGPKYHRIGLFAHAASVAVLYFVALALLRLWAARSRETAERANGGAERLCAALAALVWGLHPLRVESVAWVTERRDTLSTLFLLLALLAYLESCARKSAWMRWLGLSLLAFTASLLCKAWGMTFPLLLLVIDLLLRRGAADSPQRVSRARVIGEKLAYLPLALFFAVQAARAQGQVAAIVTWEVHGLWQRIAQACYGLLWYPLKTLWPSDLHCMVLLEENLDPTQPVYVVAQVLVALALIALPFAWRRWPALVYALLCYAILVSPVLGFLQSGSQKVADRYAHLASIPFSLLLAGALQAWLSREGAAKALRARLGIALALCVVLAGVLGAKSRAQTRVWKDSHSLFAHAVEVDPDNYFMLHNLAAQYWKQSRLEDSKQLERRSVEAHPGVGNVEARFSMGELMRLTGDPEGAIEAWRGVLQLMPDHTRSLQHLTNLLLLRKDPAGAVEACEASLQRVPGFVDGWLILAGVHARNGQREAALATWQRAIQVMPRTALLQNGYGKALQEAGRLAEAEPFLVRAIELENHNVEFATDASALFLALGRKQQAADLLRQIVAVAPNHARARMLLEQAAR